MEFLMKIYNRHISNHISYLLSAKYLYLTPEITAIEIRTIAITMELATVTQISCPFGSASCGQIIKVIMIVTPKTFKKKR